MASMDTAPEDTTVFLAGINQTLLAELQATAAWDGKKTAPFTTKWVRDLATTLLHFDYSQNYQTGQDSIGLLNKANNEINELKADLAQLTTENRRLTQSLDLALAAATVNPRTAQRQQQIDSPDKFTGDRKTYGTFKAQIRTKLVADEGMFRNEQHKMLFITNLLGGNAHKMIYPYLKNDRIDFDTIDDLWKVLDNAYDDPDRKGTAERELATLRQGTGEFSVYYSNFSRLMAELQWDDSAKKAALRQGMAEPLKDLLLCWEAPDNWHDYVQLLQRLDSKIRQRDAEKKKPSSATPTPRATPSTVTPHITQNPKYLGPAPMDLSAQEKQAERDRIYQERRAAGVCTYCGGGNHFRAACPRRKRKTLAAAEATITEISDESGKAQSHAE